MRKSEEEVHAREQTQTQRALPTSVVAAHQHPLSQGVAAQSRGFAALAIGDKLGIATPSMQQLVPKNRLVVPIVMLDMVATLRVTELLNDLSIANLTLDVRGGGSPASKG